MFFSRCQALWIFSLINYEPPSYDNGKYVYPVWAHAIGWSLTAISLICIPIFAVIAILKADGNGLLQVSTKTLNHILLNYFLFIQLIELS